VILVEGGEVREDLVGHARRQFREAFASYL